MPRPNAHFAYCVLTRYLTEAKLTQRAFGYPSIGEGGLDLMSIYADSSLGNGEDKVEDGLK